MSNSFTKITVLGAGRWGTAMAIYLSKKDHLQVSLQCHLQAEFDSITNEQKAPNLPNFSTGGRVTPVMDLNEAVASADLVVISTPVPFLRSLLDHLTSLKATTPIVTINKGIERGTLKTVPEIVNEILPNQPVAHLGGPCFPEGLLSDLSPVAETLACADAALGQKIQELFASPSFRVYRSTELKGVAILGALKNVYAIIAGIATGMGMYEEATAVLVTRGLAEMKQLCDKLEVPMETLYGLSGLGDLALTCYSLKSSHNKNFGLRLGKGETPQEILDHMGSQVAEGYYTTRAAYDLSQKLEVEMPLCAAAYEIIYNNQPAAEVLAKLMSRPLKAED
ncbi:MAG: NAD(P)H-dependent glycerol-3-phosphate dehydrogenase [SAR324 cluster bacterium]|nr:NAD(P)H-dependent glycerol-3-phosphate dehydrogenase [SAR324 cluster bacterium]